MAYVVVIIGLMFTFIVYVYTLWSSSSAFSAIFTTILLGGGGFSASEKKPMLETKFLDDPAGMRPFIRTVVIASIASIASKNIVDFVKAMDGEVPDRTTVELGL